MKRLRFVNAALALIILLAACKKDTGQPNPTDPDPTDPQQPGRASLSVARADMTVAAAGNKIVFAGGLIGAGNYDITDVVDIYDAATDQWTTARLSEKRRLMKAITVGTKIFFAGGNKSASTFSDVITPATIAGRWHR